VKNFHKVGALVGATLLATSAMAAGVVGTWKGTIHVQFPPLPSSATPQQKQQVEMVKKMMAQMKIVVNFKANKSYHLTATGGPAKSDQTEDGRWALAGKTLTMWNSKPKNAQDKEQKLTLSADGKTLTMLPPSGGMKVVVTFTR